MKAKFRLGQKIYIHGRKPGKIRNKLLKDNIFYYDVIEEDGARNRYKENEISFFRE